MRWLRYLWALPNALIGLLLALLWYWPRDFSWSGTAVECTARNKMLGNPGGQTWGWVVFYRKDRRDFMPEVASFDPSHVWWYSRPSGFARLRRHEHEHVRQGLRWGPLFLVAYPAEFFWQLAKLWKQAYRNISWERKARAAE